jgi:ligand-binding sensor domain-containing protein/signal transduction histidine kinase
MWFGTIDGLNRFDGFEFTVYKHEPRDSNSLSSSNITCLVYDEDGTLWIGTNGGGLNSFDHRTGKFTRYNMDLGPTHNQYVWSLCKGRDGILWIGADVVIGLDKKSGRIFTIDSSEIMSPGIKVVRAIYEDTAGVLWVGTWFDGVNKIEKDRRRVSTFRHDSKNPNSLSENHVISIFQDSHGGLWFGTYTGGLNRFDAHKETFTRSSKQQGRTNGLNDNTVRTMYEDREGRLWLGTSGGGVNILDMKTGHVSYLMHDNSNPTSLRGDHVFAIHEDNSGTLWFATDGGLSKYSHVKHKFSLIPVGSHIGSLPAPVGALCEDRHGELWIANYAKGLTKYVREEKSFTHYTHDRKSNNSFGGGYIATVLADHLGFVWAGTVGNGLSRFDPHTGFFKTYKIESSDPSRRGNSVDAIYEDTRGNLWIGTGRSLALLDRSKDRFTYFGDYASIARRDLAVFNIQCILEERENTLWLGTQFAGLIEYDPQRGVLSHFEHDELDTNSISSNDVRIIHRDRQDRLWLGTYGRGIDLYDRNTRTFGHLTEREGLLSNIIHGILEDDNGNLWISTPKGLSRFNPDAKAIRNYDAADGLSGLVYRSCVKSRTGEMIVGSERGLFVFHPGNLVDNTHVPNIVLTAFNVLSEPYPLPQAIHSTKEIILDHNQNFFSFEFAALDYTNPQKNQYAYRLEGVDDNWVQAGTRRYANYTHLDPGKYVFRVKGSNNDGVWNEKGTSVSIVITPPFWQTWWFRVLTLLAVGALVTLAYNYRVNRLLKLERVRVRIARDLHDELGSNLSGIALASRMVQESPNLTDEQRCRLSEISDSAMQTADAMREIVWFINPEHDRPGNLVLKMKDVASAMLNGVEVSFESRDDVFEDAMDIESRRHLFLIFKEILNNIVKHAQCSKVEIRLERQGGTFRMTVVDNGVSFDPQCAHAGSGLRNVYARAEGIRGTIDVVSSPGKGTRITLETKTT